MARENQHWHAAWRTDLDLADGEHMTAVQRRRQALEQQTRGARSQRTRGCSSVRSALASAPCKSVDERTGWWPALSRHGSVRLQQRGITMALVVTVMDFGVAQQAHGATRFFLDKRGRQRLASEMPGALRAFNGLDIQVVVADDARLITAAHRTKRVRRDIQRRARKAGAVH